MRVLFACTRGAGHFNPVVPFIEACLRGGHEVLVVGPPPLAETVERAGYPFAVGAEPPEEELGPVWGRVPTASFEEAERLVIGEIFATLNVRAMLPGMRAAVRDWRPDVIAREPAEWASAVVAEEEGVPHVEIGITLAVSHAAFVAIAKDSVDAWSAGLTERISRTPYLTLFPASLEDPDEPGPAETHRFRDPRGGEPAGPLADWWDGDERPLVYVTFGTATATLPTAVPIYGAAMEAVADLDARVLLTTSESLDGASLPAAPPHVHVAQWVPQADVLPHAAAVVCHGGSGTTLGSLAAGVPLVVTPLFADQPENGRRVAEVGAGLSLDRPAPGGVPGAADLRDAITRVLADDGFREAAGAIAADIRGLPPADEALGVLERAV